MANLEEIINGSEPVEASAPAEAPAEPVAAEPAAEVEPTQERPRGPDGKFIPKGETADAPPASSEPQLDHAALLGERRRRQEVEARLAEMEAKFAQPAPQPVQQQGPPDRWEDPDGYDQWLVGQAANAARAEATQTFRLQRIASSADQVRAAAPDYDEKIAVFGQMVNANPALLQELYRAPNPAQYAYSMAKTQLEISQFGGIDGLINARVQEALKTHPAAPQVPGTLADAQSSRGAGGSYEPPSLEDLLKRGK